MGEGEVCGNGIGGMGEGEKVLGNRLILGVLGELYGMVGLGGRLLMG